MRQNKRARQQIKMVNHGNDGVKEVQQTLETEQQISSVFAPPEYPAGYEVYVKGATDRFLTLSEKAVSAEIESKKNLIELHKLELGIRDKALTVKASEVAFARDEQKQVHTDFRLSLIINLVVIFCFIALAMYFFDKGSETLAGATLGLITGLIAIITYSKNKHSNS
jgi:hypothetical protein